MEILSSAMPKVGMVGRVVANGGLRCQSKT
jgi:hypothetical protein